MYRFILMFALAMTTLLTNVNAEQSVDADQTAAPQTAVSGEAPLETADAAPVEPAAAPAAETAQAEPAATTTETK